MSIRNEFSQIQSLVNLYRVNPGAFNDDQIDVLSEKADLYNINFTPRRDSSSLYDIVNQAGDGFIRGLIPFVPPQDTRDLAKSTSEKIAYSLGHLAGFAPSILSAPLKGATAIARAAGIAKSVPKGGFIGQKAVSTLDNWSLPMIAGRQVRKGIDNVIDKTKLQSIEALQPGRVRREILQEAANLGTAGTVSEVWNIASADDKFSEFLNVGVQNAIFGGAFGGIGNWRSIANLFGAAKTPQMGERAEGLLKAAVGSTITGVPSTITGDEDLSMQLYHYLLGGFFGYSARPAYKIAGSEFINKRSTLHPEMDYKPEARQDFNKLTKETKDYVLNESTDLAYNTLRNIYKIPNAEINNIVNKRLQYSKDKSQAARDKEVRDYAYELNINTRVPSEKYKAERPVVADNSEDAVNELNIPSPRILDVSNNIYNSLGNIKTTTSVDNIQRSLLTTINKYKINNDDITGINTAGFIKELKQNGIYDQYLSNKKNENNLRSLFTQSVIKERDVLVYNQLDGTVTEQKAGYVDGVQYVGKNDYNSPILDTLGIPGSFKVLNVIKGKKDYENIFIVDPFGETSNILRKDLANINSSLAKQGNGSYIFAGMKDKSGFVIAEFNDRNGTLKFNELKKSAGNLEKDLESAFKDSEKEFVKFYKGDISKDIHERAFVSNIMHELSFHGYNINELPKILTNNYFKHAVDYNKRMQLYMESSGMPLHRENFTTLNGGDNLRFAILKDEQFNIDEISDSSNADGGLIFLTRIGKEAANAVGLESLSKLIKPVVLGRIQAPVDKGLVALKASGSFSEAYPAIDKLMKRDGLDFVVFESANKIKSETKPTDYQYNKETGEYDLVGQLNYFDISTESLRINPTAYEKTFIKKQGDNLYRQFFSTANPIDAPKAKEYMRHYFDYTINGSFKAKELVENYNKTQDIKEIKKYLTEDSNRVYEFPSEFFLKQLSTNDKNGDIFRRAFQRVSETDNPMSDDFSYEVVNELNYKQYHNRNSKVYNAMQGGYAANNFHKMIFDDYLNSVGKYVRRTLDSPYWPYAQKSTAAPVTKDSINNADMIKVDRDRFLKKEDGLIVLGGALKKMKVRIDIDDAQRSELNKIKKGIDKNNESTMEHLWSLYKISKKLGTPEQNNQFQLLSKETVQKLNESLDLLVIRVPAYDFSGTRVLRMAGFLPGGNKASATSSKDDFYLGGMDKDIDSIQIIQSGSRDHINDLLKVKDRKFNEKNTFGTKNFGNPLNKFSPHYRVQSYSTSRLGEGQRGLSIGYFNRYYDLYENVKAGNVPGVTLKEKAARNMQNNIKDIIDINNDSSNYSTISRFNAMNNKVFKDSFNGKMTKKAFDILNSSGNFYTKFKTQPFKTGDKTYDGFLKNIDTFQKSNQNFTMPEDTKFKIGLENNIFSNLFTVSDAKDISIKFKNIDTKKIDEQDVPFVKELFGINKPIVNRFQEPNKDTRENVYEAIGVNLSKVSVYELLNDYGYRVYKNIGTKKNVESVKNQLSNLYKRAEDIRIRINKAAKNNDNKSAKVPDLDEAIVEVKKDIKEYVGRNKLNQYAELYMNRYFETALLEPTFLFGNKDSGFVFRENKLIYSSDQINGQTLRNYFEKFENVYNRVEKIDDVPKNIIGSIPTNKKDLVLAVDRSIGETNKVYKQIKKDKYKVGLGDVAARTDEDALQVKELRKNLQENPALTLDDMFYDYVLEKDIPRDISTINMEDIRGINSRFLEIKTGKTGLLDRSAYWSDPRTVDRRLIDVVKKFDQTYTLVDAKGNFKEKTVKKLFTPMGEMRQFARNNLRLQNAKETESMLKDAQYFDSEKYGLTNTDKVHLYDHISFRRNEGQQEPSAKAKQFLTKKFKGKTGQELVKEYDDKFTAFIKEIGKDIYTYNKNGQRFDYDSIDAKDNFKAIVVNDNIRFLGDGSMDRKLYYNRVIKPIFMGRNAKRTTIEEQLRYQYEDIMETKLGKKANLQSRLAYREKYKFKDYAFGFLDPQSYWPRTNYNKDNASTKLYNESVDKLIKEGKITRNDADLMKENHMRDSTRIEDNYLNHVFEFRDRNYKDVGYKNKPKNLLQRGELFIDGYDKGPDMYSIYRQQIDRSYFANMTAIHGNKVISDFKSADNTAFNARLSAKQNKNLQQAGYKNNTDLWSDFLYMHLKDTLGHPSLLTDRIQKSISKGDPLKLKYNPYYLTTDYAVTNGLERLYKTGKFDKMPYMKNAPENPEARRDYFVRRLHNLGMMEAKYNLVTLLANTGSMMTNLYGGGTMTIGSAGTKHYVNALNFGYVTKNLLQNRNGDYIIKLKSGKAVKTRKDLYSFLDEKGVIDNYIKNEFDTNPNVTNIIKGMGKNSVNFTKEITRAIKNGADDESVLQIANRYGVGERLVKAGGFFMSSSERINRRNAFVAHALKMKERLGEAGVDIKMDDPFIFEAGLRGIETTQFLYHNSFRPAFMRTALGRVLTRFKLFAFQSVRVRKEFYQQAKAQGFKQNTDAYKRFKDLYLTDLFTAAIGGMYMYSLFDVALPPPWDWFQQTGDLLFGDKKERERAFYGTLPRPIAPLQIALPPLARFPQTFVELLQGDWEKFSDYSIHTMYPGGRLYYSYKKTKERPERFFHNFFRLPVDKVQYDIKREQLRDARQKTISEFLDE